MSERASTAIRRPKLFARTGGKHDQVLHSRGSGSSNVCYYLLLLTLLTTLATYLDFALSARSSARAPSSAGRSSSLHSVPSLHLADSATPTAALYRLIQTLPACTDRLTPLSSSRWASSQASSASFASARLQSGPSSPPSLSSLSSTGLSLPPHKTPAPPPAKALTTPSSTSLSTSFSASRGTSRGNGCWRMSILKGRARDVWSRVRVRRCQITGQFRLDFLFFMLDFLFFVLAFRLFRLVMLFLSKV